MPWNTKSLSNIGEGPKTLSEIKYALSHKECWHNTLFQWTVQNQSSKHSWSVLNTLHTSGNRECRFRLKISMRFGGGVVSSRNLRDNICTLKCFDFFCHIRISSFRSSKIIYILLLLLLVEIWHGFSLSTRSSSIQWPSLCIHYAVSLYVRLVGLWLQAADQTAVLWML